MWKCGNVQVSPKLSKVADLHQQNNLIGPWKLSVRALSFSIGFNIISSSGNYEFRLVPCPSLWLSYIGVRSTLSFLLLFPSCWLEFLDWAQPWLITLRYLVTTGLWWKQVLSTLLLCPVWLMSTSDDVTTPTRVMVTFYSWLTFLCRIAHSWSSLMLFSCVRTAGLLLCNWYDCWEVQRCVCQGALTDTNSPAYAEAEEGGLCLLHYVLQYTAVPIDGIMHR